MENTRGGIEIDRNIRDCANILRKFRDYEWNLLKDHLLEIIHNTTLNSTRMYEYLKEQVEIDTSTPYNKNSIYAIHSLIIKYKAFNVRPFLELLEDIQTMSYLHKSVDILRDFGEYEWNLLNENLHTIIKQGNLTKIYSYIREQVKMDENVKPKLKPSNPSYNKYTIAGINELIKQNIFDIESFFKLLDAIQNISYNVKPVEITNKNIKHEQSYRQSEDFEYRYPHLKPNINKERRENMRILFGNPGELPRENLVRSVSGVKRTTPLTKMNGNRRITNFFSKKSRGGRLVLERTRSRTMKKRK
jgi:hypothetical protein